MTEGDFASVIGPALAGPRLAPGKGYAELTRCSLAVASKPGRSPGRESQDHFADGPRAKTGRDRLWFFTGIIVIGDARATKDRQRSPGAPSS